MKNFNLVLRVAGTMLVLASNPMLTTLSADSLTNIVWTAPARAARKENPVPTNAKSIAQGKELYVANCLVCHGATGVGDGSAAGILERNGVFVRAGNLADPKLRQETDGALFWKLTEGNSPMPAWGETLSEEQRWAVINYVRTFPPQTKVPVIAPQPKKKDNYD